MDQQRRLLTFTVLSFVILFGWMNLGPKLFPGMFPKPVPKVAQKNDKKPPAADKTSDSEDVPEPDKTETPAVKLPEHPTKTVVIGSSDPQTGFGLRVMLSSVGAGVVSAELNDPRYKVLKVDKPKGPTPQLSLLGNNLTNPLRPLESPPAVTGHVTIDEVDAALEKLDSKASLSSLNWEVVKTETDEGAKGGNSAVTFGLKTPDGNWEIHKRYEVRRWTAPNPERDADPEGYQLGLQLTLKNLGEKEATVVYDMQGPVGVPLENAEHASKFRDVKFGFREADGDLVTNSLTIGELIKAHDKGKIEDLKAGDRTFQYVGLDTQYFAALVLPQDAAAKRSTFIDLATPQVIARNAATPNWSEVGVRLHSVKNVIPPASELQHDFRLYLGPKRVALLEPLGASKVIDYSGFLFIPASLVALIGNGLLWILNGFHGVGIPYGICVMMLTVLVRSCMFPISKKQAVNAKKMKELQPKLAELKEKHGDDKQKMAQAQMDLFAEHGFNPFGGCLPLLLQLPIFIGLYQSLSSSVDLRRAPFLWFDNLAAPDALFLMPWKLPFLGNEFNLLPIITTSLFLFQQKMFMPPPTDEQTRMQAKMFFWMTLFMGFLFYHVPAGLCVYFIASSLWSMAERKLLDYGTSSPPNATSDPAKLPPPAPKGDPGNVAPPNQGLFGRLAAKLEELGEMKDINGIPVSGQRHGKGDKKKKKQRW